MCDEFITWGAYYTFMRVVSYLLKSLLRLTSSGATCVSSHKHRMVQDVRNSG